MKASYLFLFCFVIIFSFIIQSCGNENMLTQPLEKPASNVLMAKPAVSQISTTDTLITLTKSGKMLMLPKGLPAKQMDKLDKFLSQNKTPAATASFIQPNAEMCGWHTTYAWEFEYVYTTVPNKYLGIWTNYLTPSQSFSYGFNQLFINYGSKDQINAAITVAQEAGFSSRNLMVSLGDTNSAIASYIINNTTDVGYYFIDEPIEKSKFGDSIFTVIPNLANLIYAKNSNDKLLLSSYALPFSSSCYTIAPGTGYQTLMGYLHDNIFIQCDKYSYNCCGNVDYVWDSFKNYYGIAHNFSNWMNVTENDGTREGDWPCAGGTFPNSTGWSTLFGLANAWGINNLWLYANDTGNEDAVRNFCYSAWANGWLIRRAKQVQYIWKCDYPNPCTSCIWGSTDISMWNVVSWSYTGVEQYFSY